ncbi:MAG: AmmeMemoRadiSam system protein B [Gemmatimonadetes bacterium]|nr:AmmeMemoRadiSam system protein B [Gemmatimonadota bacterium]
MSTRSSVRPPAVAGRFYPAGRPELESTVRDFLEAAPPVPDFAPVALVAPHAGYVYSGPVAGSAYALVRGTAATFRRVVLLGPSHYVPFRGLALPECEAFSTPLGEHAVDAGGARELSAHPAVRRWARPHGDEHSLEVQIPFLRVALGALPILPLVTGDARPEEVADVLDLVWTADTLVVVSSDLSHYLPYQEARRVDADTAAAVESLDIDAVAPHRACGAVALRGLMVAARRRGLEARCVDLRSSGDTASGRHGPRGRVVGYGAFGFRERETADLH